MRGQRLIRELAGLVRPRKARVFGLGLNKTGTSSLAAALTLLGYRHMGCRPDLLKAFKAGELAKVFRVTDWYESFDDWPYPLMYRELFVRYGRDARYVLTLRRSPEDWLESLKSFSLVTDPKDECRSLAYGWAYPHGVESEFLERYQTHADGVRAFFEEQGASDCLLEVCWEAGDGWEQLCGFLGVPIPSAPFPHLVPKGTASDAVKKANLEAIERQQAQLARSGGARG